MSNAQRGGGVLCPVDLNGQSGAVIDLAASIARSCSVPLFVVHASIHQVPPYFTHGDIEHLEEQLRQNREAVRRKLADAVKHTPGAEIHAEEGEPLSVILRLSETLHPSMIVMGTHARTGLARTIDGSVAESLVRSSAIPVLTMGPGDRVVASPPVLCAVTDNELSRISLSWAARLAQCFGSSLTVLHVVEPGARGITDLCAWVGHDHPRSCEIQEVVRHGDAADEVLRHAAQSGAGLLVVGATHTLISDKTVIGATAEKLLRHAPCPVLTVFPGNRDLPGGELR